MKKPVVTFFQRKPRSVGNYSVEFIFEDVRKRLSGSIIPKTFYSKYESNGFFKRIYNCIEAAMNQSEINHVTGDINYIGLLLSKRKTIHTILDCVFMTATSGIRQKILKLFWLTVPVKQSKYITAISEATKQEIIKYTGCNPDKIKVIYVAISERFMRQDKPFNKVKPVILQIGTAPNKNIPRLIEAIKDISCELHIIGRKIPEYETLLSENKMAYRYESGLTDEEMVQRYASADIIALASTYEGFGMPILEAQAVGRPVITSNLFSMPEVAGDATCMVNPYQVEEIKAGIKKIIEDDQYRQALVEKGFENIKRFHPQRIAEEYLALYSEIHKN
jgi:glycosyltransferase involved in cell wall biosynthesis